MANQIPSGRWGGRVRDPRTGKQVAPHTVVGGPKTYATKRLDAARPIRIPAPARRQMAEIERARHELRGLHGRPPTAEDIAQRAGLSVRSAGRTSCHGLARRAGRRRQDPARRADRRRRGARCIDGCRGPGERAPPVVDARPAARAPARGRGAPIRPARRRRGRSSRDRRLGLGEERSRQLERQALHRLRHMAGGSQLAA